MSEHNLDDRLLARLIVGLKGKKKVDIDLTKLEPLRPEPPFFVGDIDITKPIDQEMLPTQPAFFEQPAR